MGRDLTIYPDRARKTELKKHIESLGFSKSKHLWEWPKGTIHYFWYELEDYKSIDGVQVDLYPVTESEKNENNVKSDWAIHVRNRYSASIYDVIKLNEVLRSVRKAFGGKITGDYGVNKFAPLWDDKSTPLGRGISRVYSEVIRRLETLEYALPDPMLRWNDTADPKSKHMKVFNRSEPIRIVYNAVIPFIVAAFEYFFSQVFMILLKYDNASALKIESHNQKIALDDVIQITKGLKTIEGVIAEMYSFQNIDKTVKAYKGWTGLDLNSVLFKKRRIDGRINFLKDRMEEIVQFRHAIVHSFQIDDDVEKKDINGMIKTLRYVIKDAATFFSVKYKFELDEM